MLQDVPQSSNLGQHVPKMSPRWAQDEPKMSPKWPKMGNMSQNWTQNEPQNDHPSGRKRTTYRNIPKMPQNARKMVPKCSQVDPKCTQNEPQMVPSWPKMLPRRSQGAPRAPSWAQMSWKCCKIQAKSFPSSQDAPKMVSRCLQRPPQTGASEASGGLLWMTFLHIQNYHKYSPKCFTNSLTLSRFPFPC